MRQPFLFLYVCISTVCHASTGDLTSVHSSAISVHEVGNRGETILEERAFAPGSDRPAFSTPEDLEDRADTPSLGRGSVRTDASHEPISPGRNEGNRGAHSGFALSVPDTAEATTNSQVHAGSSLNLSERFKDGVRNTEWEKALAMIPEKVKVVPSPCVQGFKRAYTSFADVLSLFSLIMYGISGVASGLGGIDYLSHNAFLKPDVMVTVVGLGLIGTALFRYLWVSLSYVKKMDQKRLVSYERRAKELETEKYTDAQLSERLERANIFLMYPSQSMVTARQFLFNFLCCSETLSSTFLAIAGGVFATSAASGVTDKDLLRLGSQDLYLSISQGSALIYAIIYLVHEKAKLLKDRCEAWLTVQQLAKLYLEQVLGVEKDKIYTAIYDLQAHLMNGRENLVIM